MEEITTNAKSVVLNGEVVHVHFSSAFPYFWVLNIGGGTVLMSISPNIEEGKDGVIEVIAGSSAGTMHGYNATSNDLYLLGSGKVQIMGTYTPENPFKTARKGGEESASIKLDGLADHITGSQGWTIAENGSAVRKADCNITYYRVAEGLSVYIKAEDDSNDCKYIWSTVADVTSYIPNGNMVGEPVINAVNGVVTVPKGALYVCFSQRIDDTETGVYKLKS